MGASLTDDRASRPSGSWHEVGTQRAPGRLELYSRGLDQVRWVGEVIDNAWRAEVSVAVAHVAAKHFVVPTKEVLVEVLADAMTCRREIADSGSLNR